MKLFSDYVRLIVAILVAASLGCRQYGGVDMWEVEQRFSRVGQIADLDGAKLQLVAFDLIKKRVCLREVASGVVYSATEGECFKDPNGVSIRSLELVSMSAEGANIVFSYCRKFPTS